MPTPPGWWRGEREDFMKNTESMTITMTRIEMIRISQALLRMAMDFRDEINSSETTEAQRKSCISSLQMWEEIRAKVDSQFDAQDNPT